MMSSGSALQAHSDPFASTRWRLTSQLRPVGREGSDTPLEDLCDRYAYSTYAQIRRRGREPDTAFALAASFRLGVAARKGTPSTEGACFREWLLERVDAWLAESAQGPAPVEQSEEEWVLADEFEARFRAELSTSLPPDRAFDRSFALELLQHALSRLRLEASSARRAPLFDALEPYLSVDPPPGRYEELARQLEAQAFALVIALKRLRGRFRELVEMELADTVASEDGFRSERVRFRDVLK